MQILLSIRLNDTSTCMETTDSYATVYAAPITKHSDQAYGRLQLLIVIMQVQTTSIKLDQLRMAMVRWMAVQA